VYFKGQRDPNEVGLEMELAKKAESSEAKRSPGVL